jgi:hypothetical protein
MNPLVADLTVAVPEEHRSALSYWDARLKGTIRCKPAFDPYRHFA